MHMQKITLLVLLIAVSTFSIPLFAGGFALSGVGSRSTAMGGAFRGLSDDATAMYWNPAGLAFQDGMSISLGGTFIMPSAKWKNPGVPTLRPGETESEKNLKAIPSVFLTMATHPKLKYGLGMYVPYGLGSSWDLYETNPGLIGAADFPKNETSSSITIFDLHPTIAYQISPKASAGLGVSLMYGTIDMAKFGESSYTPLYLLTTTDISGKGMGIGANFGFLYKPQDNLSLGFSGKIPSSIKMEGDTKITNYGVQQAALGNTIDTETTLKLPAEAGIGASFKCMPNLILNLDYAYTMWSSLDKVVLKLKTSAGTVENDMVFDWEDTSRISLGAEYTLGADKIRVGGYWEQSPVPESTQTPALSDIGDKISANLGWGRKFGNLGLDLNFQYVNFAQREVKTPTLDNLPGTYNAQSLSGNIGLSWDF